MAAAIRTVAIMTLALLAFEGMLCVFKYCDLCWVGLMRFQPYVPLWYFTKTILPT